jgi:hypothetical protein
MPTIMLFNGPSGTGAAIPASTTSANLLAGNLYEFPPFNAVAEFGFEASAQGLQVTVTTGTDIIAQGVTVPIANRAPIYPDDFVLNDVIHGGERLTLVAQNITAGALNLWTTIKLTPL